MLALFATARLGTIPSMLAACFVFTTLALGAHAAEPAVAESSTAEQQLKILEGRYNSEQAKLWAEAAKATDQTERDRLFSELDPASTMIEDFLKLEEQHRGTPAGLSVLHHLVSVAGGSYGFSGDIPVTNAGRKALEILTEHYAGHPDLDVFFFWLHSDPAADKFLTRALESPHRHVRGTARFSLARLRHLESWVPASFDAKLGLLAADVAKNAEELDYYTRLRQRWNNIDAGASRKEVLRLLDDTIETYSDVLEAPRTTYGPVLLKIERGDKDAQTQMPRRKLSQLAEALRFEMLNLTVGQKAPEIAGPDALGNDLKLSDHRGKTAVIMFSFKGCGPCEAMYPDNRKLIETYAGRPFAFLGIMGDTELATVKESVESKTITWPVWWDGGGTHGPLATKWNVSGWPTLYILDHHGVIRFRNLRGDLLALAVARLVAEAEQAR